ncbi:hypothetical protein [Nostoc sp.]|uniref:hypothetical protein n=1 Tax=Nostoc sp. TaxID=1180 RepID=UPI002FF655B5
MFVQPKLSILGLLLNLAVLSRQRVKQYLCQLHLQELRTHPAARGIQEFGSAVN